MRDRAACDKLSGDIYQVIHAHSAGGPISMEEILHALATVMSFIISSLEDEGARQAMLIKIMVATSCAMEYAIENGAPRPTIAKGTLQ